LKSAVLIARLPSLARRVEALERATTKGAGGKDKR
jgi:hypothetical protein